MKGRKNLEDFLTDEQKPGFNNVGQEIPINTPANVHFPHDH